MLKKIDHAAITAAAEAHRAEWGDTNEKISRLFALFPDNTSYAEVRIKATVINSIYSTRIGYLDPVIKQIISVYSELQEKQEQHDQLGIVDRIAEVAWTDKNGSRIDRHYLSFASKYMHFQSGCELPIYDDYMWQVMRAYLRCHETPVEIPSRPVDYKQVSSVFERFKTLHHLDSRSNYDVEKFLWRTFRDIMRKLEQDGSGTTSKANDPKLKARSALTKLTQLL